MQALFLFLVIAPIFVFSANPESSVIWRFCRLLLAIIIGYILINLSLHSLRELNRQDYEDCLEPLLIEAGRSSLPNSEIYEKCEHHVNIADGASNVFYLFLGWIPAAAYVAIYELIWRVRNSEKIKAMGSSYKGKWFSNLGIILSIPVWLFAAPIILIVLAALIKKALGLEFL